ncbi:hypothetical protein ACIRRA_30730 [Nocardia sp. NPDC101769]|uniref:hypothetical protein n=1 Tax=Nocardia sp. NPDC101769 TaxID=3364333 RepID=UPI003807BA64
MHTNTSRAIGLGITAGVVAGIATLATVIAIDDWDLDTRVSEAVARTRMTPAERTELSATKRLLDHQARQRREQRELDESHKRSKFHPYLLSTPSELTELSLSGLICEILAARRQLRHAWAIDPTTGRRDYSVVEIWTDQLEAMRSEFNRRRHNPAPGQALPLLDRMRWQAAYSAVHADIEVTTNVPGLDDHATAVAQS